MRNSLSSKKLKLKNQKVDVLFYFNGRDQYARPVRLAWDEVEYELGGVQFWYAERRSGMLIHHYRVGDEDGDYIFELSLETENLTWRLEQATRSSHETVTRGTFMGATS